MANQGSIKAVFEDAGPDFEVFWNAGSAKKLKHPGPGEPGAQRGKGSPGFPQS